MDDNKKSTTIWLRPSVISRMDGWLEADNCQSRSEFVDKALRFYMGYLGTEDNTAYLSQAILTAIQGMPVPAGSGATYFSAGRPDIPPLSLPRETASWQQAQRHWPAIQTTGGFCIFRIFSPRRNRGCRI